MIADAPFKTKSDIRKEAVTFIRKYHEFTLDHFGDNVYFDCKSINTIDPVGKIGFFKSQLDTNSDIYLELTGFKIEVTDLKRTLYKLKNNPNYLNEPDKYEFREKTPAGSQYYIDIKLLEVIPHFVEGIDNSPMVIEDEFEEGNNMLVENLTARDYACIHLKVAESSNQWINNLINKSKK